jgi:hypothetical protein
MAVYLAGRIAIALGPSALRWITVSAPVTAPQFVVRSQALWQRLHDPAEADSELATALSDSSGYSATVTTYSTTFELRKLQVLFSRTSGAATPEDDAVVTFHFLKLAGGAPSDSWIEADFTTVEAALDTYLTTVRAYLKASTAVKQFRWYAAGPQVDADLGGPGRTGPPRRVVDRNAAGTYALSSTMPPQIALSVTEKTSDPTAWGRTYLPFQMADNQGTTAYGRVQTDVQTAIGNAADTFYEACRTADLPVVVYSSAKPSRSTAGGGTLPARDARALTVDELQVDDLFDVIRSRRWSEPLLRLQRAVGA